MATDYDAPRKTDDDLSEDSIEELKSRRVDKSSSSVDVDETEQAEGFELPGADLSGEELSVRVLPKQADEFTCSRCFLVHPDMQLAGAGWHEQGEAGAVALADLVIGQQERLGRRAAGGVEPCLDSQAGREVADGHGDSTRHVRGYDDLRLPICHEMHRKAGIRLAN